MNLLSYDGGQQENYSGFKFRYEGGVLIEDEGFAAEVMRDFEGSRAEVDDSIDRMPYSETLTNF